MSDPGFPFTLNHSYNFSSSYHDGPSGADYPGSNAGSYLSFWRDKFGQDTPGWPHVIRDNGYMTVKSSLSEQGISYDFRNVNGSHAQGMDSAIVKLLGSNAASDIMSYSWPVIVELYNAARPGVINKLISRTKNQKINIGQFIAERQQTVNLVVSTAKRLAESIQALKRGNVKHAIFSLTGNNYATSRASEISRMGGGIPQQWLALQYGWLPLLSDVDGSCQELAKLVTGEPSVTSVRGSSRANADRAFTFHGGDGQPGFEMTLTKGLARGNGYIEWLLSSDFGQSLSRNGIVNPYSLAWEVIPYSFVVDWFIPIGNFLSNLDYETGLVFKRGWLSMKIELEWTVSLIETSQWPPGFNSGSWSGEGFKGRVDYFQREALSAAPMPPPPDFKNPLSLTHVANALSLLATAFDRGSGRKVR